MGMDWKKLLSPPERERDGNKVFTLFVLSGITLMIFALSGVYLEGFQARLGGFLAGAGLSAGAGSTLALAYGEWPEENRFALKIAARAGFLPLAPCLVLMELPYLLEEVGVWGCIGLCALTVVPFGLSLVLLMAKRRKSFSL